MASKEALKNARQLLDLDVKEVSLVDSPANLREFLIVKRQAEDNLGVFETPGAPTQSIRDVLEYLSTQSRGGDLVDVKETVEMVKARHGYEVETCKAGKTEETLEELTKRHEVELAEVAKADSEEPPAEPEASPAEPETPPAEEPEPKEEAVAKSEPEPEPEEQPLVVIKQDGSINVAGQTVQKAKTFGKAKTATLQNAVSALAKLLGDVSEDALKAAMSPYMDPTKKVEKAAEPTPEPTPTADPAEVITKAVEAALEPITKRLEAIEKTRNPSQSVEGDGGTDTKVEKGDDNIWAGIL